MRLVLLRGSYTLNLLFILLLIAGARISNYLRAYPAGHARLTKLFIHLQPSPPARNKALAQLL